MGFDGIGPPLHAHRHEIDEGIHYRAEGGKNEVNIKEEPTYSSKQLAHGVTLFIAIVLRCLRLSIAY